MQKSKNIKNKQKDNIPEKFESIEAAAEFWDSHDVTDYFDLTKEVSDVKIDLTRNFKMKKKFIFLFIISFFLYPIAILKSQITDKTTITIQTYSTIKVPADEIIFTITLNAIEKDAKKSYNKHKEIEKDLISLLRKLSIPDSCINYSLMDISKHDRYRKKETYFRTQQRVRVKLSDMSQYESFQIALLSNGIENFRAGFTSSQRNNIIDEVPIKALDQARAEAKNIADKIGKKIGNIIEISTRRYEQSSFEGDAITVVSEAKSLLDIQQFVQFRAHITAKFELIN